MGGPAVAMVRGIASPPSSTWRNCGQSFRYLNAVTLSTTTRQAEGAPSDKSGPMRARIARHFYPPKPASALRTPKDHQGASLYPIGGSYRDVVSTPPLPASSGLLALVDAFYPWGEAMSKVVHPKWARRRKPLWRSLLAARLTLALALLAVTSVAYVATNDRSQLPRVHVSGTSSSTVAVRRAGCDIKGNINERGEHIYHMPGQAYYLATRINPARGERWFCSQWEAWWAGWRKAKV